MALTPDQATQAAALDPARLALWLADLRQLLLTTADDLQLLDPTPASGGAARRVWPVTVGRINSMLGAVAYMRQAADHAAQLGLHLNTGPLPQTPRAAAVSKVAAQLERIADVLEDVAGGDGELHIRGLMVTREDRP